MTLTEQETNFLITLLEQVVPSLSVPAKEAPAMLALSETILTKLKTKDETNAV